MACRRGRESKSSNSHEVFWASRLMPSHLTSLSAERERAGVKRDRDSGSHRPRARAHSLGEAGVRMPPDRIGARLL